MCTVISHVKEYPIFHDNKVTGKPYNKVKIVEFFLRTGLLIGVNYYIFTVSDL